MKIIATDYDGTLNHGGIDDEKRAAISLWRKKGNLFGVISGRSVPDILKIKDEKNFEYDFLVANNGAVIIGTDGKFLSDVRCEGKFAMPLIEFLFENNCPFVSVNNNIAFEIYKNTEEATEGKYTLKDAPHIDYFNQISTFLPDDEEAEIITEKIRQKFGDILNPLRNGRCIDIVDKSVNKAKGVYILLDLFGAKYEDAITVGDNVNDYDMINEFYSFAMENAVESIKEIADFQTKSITELIYSLL